MEKVFVIGLTGNIATGKSLVMRMLKELGAFTIDADKLVHLLMRRGNPLYAKVVKEFGDYILDENLEIDRDKLGRIVFSDPAALAHLERVTHPTVKQVVARLIANQQTADCSQCRVVVVEAIKLIESGMAQDYDSLWVVTAPRETQMARLVQKRRLSAADATRRIDAQPPQEAKVALADVVIDNSGDVISAWKAVQRAFADLPMAISTQEPALPDVEETEDVTIRRARRGDVAELARMLPAAAGDQATDETQILEWFFSKGFFVAVAGGDTLLAAASLRTENLVAIIDDFSISDADLWPTVGQAILDNIENESRQLSCEVALLFLAAQAGAPAFAFFEKNGYERKAPEDLAKMWREAAQGRPTNMETLFVKQLLDHRIVTPI